MRRRNRAGGGQGQRRRAAARLPPVSRAGRRASRRGKANGVKPKAISALMTTKYSTATIRADRSQKSFKLSLDAFMHKRGAPVSFRAGGRSRNPMPPSSPRSRSAMACRQGRCSPSGAWRRGLAASPAIKTRSRPSRHSPMTAGGRNISPSNSMRLSNSSIVAGYRRRHAAPCTAKSARPNSCRRTSGFRR